MRVVQAKYQQGYTLIELLVAMLLLGLVGLAIAGGMHFGARVWERSETNISTSEGVETAQQVVRSALSSALPHRSAGFVRFEGRRDSIVFYGPAPRAMETGGLARFELSLTHADDGDRIELRVIADGTKGSARDAVLAERLGRLHIDYMDATERVPAWLAVWRDRDRLPDAVRIASDDSSSTSAWPVFVVRTATAQDANCQFDPVTASCRKT